MAKTSVNEFRKQVDAERRKISWPTRAETIQTTIMVMIMAVVLAIFFFGVDTVIGSAVKLLLKLVN